VLKTSSTRTTSSLIPLNIYARNSVNAYVPIIFAGLLASECARSDPCEDSDDIATTASPWEQHGGVCKCTDPDRHPCSEKKHFFPGCHELVLLSGSSNVELATEIASILGTELRNANLRRFNDGEISLNISGGSVCGKDAFIIQSTSKPVNESVMELLLLTSALRRAGVKRVTAVIP
jgi:hypothetical protein